MFMLQTLSLLIAAHISLGALKNVFAAEGPGITVIVVDGHARPVRELDIEVQNSLGSPVLRGFVHDGRFEIADLPFGPHSLVVGKGRCGQVELKGIRFFMDSHPIFRIIHNDCPHTGDGFGSGCNVTFRSRGAAGPVARAVIIEKRTHRRLLTDSYGRAVSIIGNGQSEEFTVESHGYESITFTLSCKAFGLIEKDIILESKR